MVRRSVVHFDPASNRVSLLSLKNVPESLRLLPLLARTAEFLPKLFQWQIVKLGVAEVDCKPAIEEQPFLPMAISAPSASDVLALRGSGRTSRGSASAASGPLDICTEDVALNMRVLRSALQQNGGTTVLHTSTGLHLQDLIAMERRGVVTLSQDDSNELQVAVCDSNINLSSWQLVGSAQQVIFIDSYSFLSKLDLALPFVLQAWAPRATTTHVAFTSGSAKQFLNDYRRPNSYFLCLLDHERLFEKGVPHIHHKWKDLRNDFHSGI